MNDLILKSFAEHKNVLQASMDLFPLIIKIGKILRESLDCGGKIIFCGNGGSAADAQHLSAEFVGRYCKNRRSLPALALTTDTSIITAVANDYGYDKIFARQIEGLGRSGDVLVAISTSGNSQNVIEAVKSAKEKGIYTIAMTGATGGILKDIADLTLVAPSQKTARIQEMHILYGHIFCELVEKNE